MELFTDIGEKQTIRVANLGLTSNITGACAILNTGIEEYKPERPDSIPGFHITAKLKALGIWSVWIEAPIWNCGIDHCTVTLAERVCSKGCISIDSQGAFKGNIIRVDLHQAWRERGFRKDDPFLQPKETDLVPLQLRLTFQCPSLHQQCSVSHSLGEPGLSD